MKCAGQCKWTCGHVSREIEACSGKDDGGRTRERGEDDKYEVVQEARWTTSQCVIMMTWTQLSA